MKRLVLILLSILFLAALVSFGLSEGVYYDPDQPCYDPVTDYGPWGHGKEANADVPVCDPAAQHRAQVRLDIAKTVAGPPETLPKKPIRAAAEKADLVREKREAALLIAAALCGASYPTDYTASRLSAKGTAKYAHDCVEELYRLYDTQP